LTRVVIALFTASKRAPEVGIRGRDRPRAAQQAHGEDGVRCAHFGTSDVGQRSRAPIAGFGCMASNAVRRLPYLMAMSSQGDRRVAERRRVLLLLGRHVRVRFGLDLETFADRALEVARGAFPDGPWPDCLERLRLDDLYLAAACAAGDERAWEECGARFFGFIRDFARHRLRGPQAAEVADEVIADLWRRGKMARFEGRSSLRTWLGAVVAHAVVNAVKAARPLTSLESDVASGPGSDEAGESRPLEADAARVLTRLVERALGEMEAEDRLLLRLYYEQGLTLDEIAPTQRASKSTLSRRLARLREALRARVAELARDEKTSIDDLRPGLDRAALHLDLDRLLRGGLGEEPERVV
jgi:RNA polymerase sigma-70 factor, ECF subfamily